MSIRFNALDYTAGDSFERAKYEFEGTTKGGWVILRNGAEHLRLGPGYRALRVELCGVCATDLSRRFLPFPLPQVLGHEVVAVDPETGARFVVEINDSHAARGEATQDPFCNSGLPTHCPDRLVLGIDRLPGGFGPYILAPVNAAIPIGALSPRTAVLVEPFAAALHAVTSSPPCEGDSVAVLGPGRLGLLLTAALRAYQKSAGENFKITALGRHERLLELAREMGAGVTIDINHTPLRSLKESFDIIYDTTGSTEGLESALMLSRRELHLKSTNGRSFHGLRHLTELVVDELSIIPYSRGSMDFRWEHEDRKNEWAYVAPGASSVALPYEIASFKGGYAAAEEFLRSERFASRIPRFDLALASNMEEIDRIIRPGESHERSLVRPRGAILFRGDPGGHPLLAFIASGRVLRSSRCGDFHRAIALLAEQPDIAASLGKHMITHSFTADRLAEAFAAARGKDSIKVIVSHG